MVAYFNSYTSHRNVEVPWLDSLPKEWSLAPIKYHFMVVGGSTPKSDEATYWDGDVVWITPADLSKLSTKYVNVSARSITKKGLGSCGTSLVPEKSVIISSRAPIGSLAIATSTLCTNQGCKALVPLSIHSDSRYLYYWLLVNSEPLNVLGKGTTFLEISGEVLAGFDMPVPSSVEQETIANFLDHETAKIDTLIDKQQQLIKLLKEKRQAVISHAVTKGLNPDAPMKDSGVEWLGEVPEHWVTPKMGYLCDVTKLTGFEYTNYWQPSDDGEIIALRGFNVSERFLSLEKTEKISKQLSNRLSRSKLKAGDIVMPCTGTLGNAAVIEHNDKFHINQNIAKLSFSERLTPNFAVQWLTSSVFRTIVDFNNTSGMQPVLLIGDIRNMPIPLPPQQEQEKIIKYLDVSNAKYGQIIQRAEQSLNLLGERRTAIISAAVTGKIDVRNWQAEAEES